MFGPYPFTEIGGVVPAFTLRLRRAGDPDPAGLRPSAILDEDFAPELINHELAHMWFGDNVTLRQWNDIFNNEAYASWAQWGYNERVGGTKANDELNQTYERTVDDADFWQITMIDPSRQHLFDAVYVRGPMALQASAQRHRRRGLLPAGPGMGPGPAAAAASRSGWSTAQSLTTVDLDPFFQAWIYAPTAPARTPENGFR